jgi:hypothetical protein
MKRPKMVAFIDRQAEDAARAAPLSVLLPASIAEAMEARVWICVDQQFECG